jgi:cation/acetate symporter
MPMNLTYLIFFLAILTGTLIITYWAAKRGKTTSQFYAVSGSLSGFENGLAIAGDYISAASFLGITGAIALRGFDGFLYSIGFLVSYLLLLIVMSEPVRHLGKFTLGDVLYARFPDNRIRLASALCTLMISVLYMIPQLVAAGLLIRLLIDIDYSASVLLIGCLMTVYVIFGGMVATSWVQIVKTVLLMSGTLLLSLIVMARFDWNLFNLIQHVKDANPLGEQFFYPGNLFSDPLETLSLNLSLILGTAGLPHILIRLFTVKNAIEVRKSMLTSIVIIGLFYVMALVLGLGVVALVGWDNMMAIDPSGNLAAPLLADVLGGDFLTAFISAIAFATILAVMTGLTIAATLTLSHDVYHHIFRHGRSTEKEQLAVAKLSAAVIGLIAILFSLRLEHINVAFLVSLTFVVAASTHLPVLLFTIYWRRFNATGVVVGMTCGMAVSLILVMSGPHLMNVDSGWIRRDAIFSLYNPGIIAIPIGFLGAWLGAVLARQPADDAGFAEIVVRSQTGIE